MNRIEKVKLFVKEHKKEIAAGVITIIAGGVVFVITNKESKNSNVSGIIIPTINDLTKLDIPESLIGIGVEEISSPHPDKWFDIWMNNTPLSELGKFGEELQKTYEWGPEQTISGVVSTGMEFIEKTEF